ncbi:MAG: hypothetical protein ACJA0V_004208, partial [Planctomycetota bacterium]
MVTALSSKAVLQRAARSLRHGRANRHARTLHPMSARQILAEATDSTAFRRTNPVRKS